MWLSFVLLLMLDVPHTRGQQKIETFGQILLRFSFPSYYNGFDKSCCRFYPGGCYTLVDSKGYTCNYLKGRVTKIQNDGWIQFTIWKAELVDAGFYRCLVLGTQNNVYKDFYIEISERSVHNIPLLTSTVQPTTAQPNATELHLSQDHGDTPGSTSFPWSVDLSLSAIGIIACMIIISSITAAVCCRVTAKNKGDILPDSPKHKVPDTSSVVYTTVDFTPYEKPPELYANIVMRSSISPTSDATEYATLAIRH